MEGKRFQGMRCRDTVSVLPDGGIRRYGLRVDVVCDRAQCLMQAPGCSCFFQKKCLIW
jgi:hypothetical protein